MTDYVIRRATLADADGLARLRWDFSSPAQQAAQPFAEFRAPYVAFLAEAPASGAWVIWVAEAEGRLIGNIYVHLIDKLPRPDRFGHRWGYVTNVYVVPHLRDGGVGADLMTRVQEWARAEDLEFLLLWPSQRAIPFYQRAGFVLDADALVWELPARRTTFHGETDAVHDAQP